MTTVGMDIAEDFFGDAKSEVRGALAQCIDASVASALEEAARCAENPYGERVKALARDEPLYVGSRIAAAIRTLARERTGSAGGGA